MKQIDIEFMKQLHEKVCYHCMHTNTRVTLEYLLSLTYTACTNINVLKAQKKLFQSTLHIHVHMYDYIQINFLKMVT